jgi:light-regulated signal transduction histidine kinase (bacteriophytochrome)/CheY-like chemotaxis protein
MEVMQDKILLVDDREDNLLSIETLLEPGGYTFMKANSGRQALKILLNQFDFALILMDVQMPNLNGFETAALIYEREKLRHIPIIFITANNYGEENIFKGYQSGAVDYIYKPINPALLRAKVNVFIELYRKNRQLQDQEMKLIKINHNLEMEIKEKKISEKKIKELNHQLLEYINRLENANKELDRYAFMASHDLQEPLRKIRLFSDRLSIKYQDLIDEEGKLYLNRISNAGGRMQALINDILAFSKITAEETAFAKTDLVPIIMEVISDMDEMVQDKQAKITIDQLPQIDVIPGLMRPLFQNLISNALKYSRKDIPPQIHINAEVQPAPEDMGTNTEGSRFCRIIVEDNGIGFDQKYSEKIFEMFTRLHQNSEFEGTGIGLAICKKIVEKHRGFISAKSNVNLGSTFILSFPLSKRLGMQLK